MRNEPIDSYIHSIKNKDTQVPFIIEVIEHKLPEQISKVLIPIIEIESSIEKFGIGSQFYQLNTELQTQCIDLYDSNDDWLQAITSYLIAKECGENINSNSISEINTTSNTTSNTNKIIYYNIRNILLSIKKTLVKI